MALEKVPGSDWFWCDEARDDAPVRVFCFHGHAGSAQDFAGWATVLAADAVECYYVELPGRGLRMAEIPITDANKLIDALITELLTHMDKPFIFFGHSIGAQLAWALLQELGARGLPQPRRLLVSGATPISPADAQLAAIPDAWRDKLLPRGTAPAALEADLAVLRGLARRAGDAAQGGHGKGGSAAAAAHGDSGSGGGAADCACAIAAYGPGSAEAALRAWSACTVGEMTFYAVEAEPADMVVEPNPAAETDSDDSIEVPGIPMHGALLQRLDETLRADVQQSRAESVALIERWNAGTFDYPDSACLHELFTQSAAAHPDATAIVYQGKEMTFAEVDAATDDLAAWLAAQGVGVGSIVGIFMEHCEAYALAFIAAHKAGGAYMPLEVVYPEDLLRRVLEEAKPVVVLTKRQFSPRLPAWQLHLDMDDDDDTDSAAARHVAPPGAATWRAVAAAAPRMAPGRALPTPDSLAYVVMSSGTTGVPKGICCPHRGAVHSYYYRLIKYPYTQGEREACSVFFVWEMLRPLLGGLGDAGSIPVPLYVIPDDIIYNPARLVEYLGANAITRVLFTPSLLQLILDTCSAEQLKAALATMRIIWLCGEVVTVELRDKVAALLPHIQLENLYSISECHDISYANLNSLNTRESPKYAPCGTVIPNVKALILDEQMRQVPVGVPGRMYIGGPCLALGYLNMPEKTAERFLPNPFRPQETIYDTGDRCRYLPSGSIEVIGRCDFMVKIRGYSVVIGAVEAAISEHPLVSTACVLTEGAEGSMDKKLVAYVVPERWERVPSAQSIQRFVRNKLPPYAIPSVFLLLDAIPINMASGKLDRRRLPSSSSNLARYMPATEIMDGIEEDKLAKDAPVPTTSGAYVDSSEDAEMPTPSASAMEQLVAEVWARVLKADAAIIKPDSDFFDLGGHSLLLVKVASGIVSGMGLEVSMPDLLQNSTLSGLAALLESRSCGAASGSPTGATATLSDTERALAKVWARVLQCSEASVRRDSNFFDLGGHSLLLIKVASGIRADLGVELAVSDVVERPVLHALAALVARMRGAAPSQNSSGNGAQNGHAANGSGLKNGAENGSGNGADVVDLPAEAAKLDPSIYPAPTRKAGYSRFRVSAAAITPARVLLTGVTGFLGAHILHHMLMETQVVAVYCIVRARDAEHAAQRIEAALRALGLWSADVAGHVAECVVPIVGDLARPLLGLPLRDFQALAGELDAIIHAGAKVNLVRPYQSLKAANVLGTQEVLRLAVTNGFATRVKPVHYVSTNGVFPFGAGAPTRRREGDDLSEIWPQLKDGYAQTKWVAEAMCAEARRRGLPLSILRCGNMAPSSATGAWNGADFMYLALRACAQLGCAPDAAAGWKVDMTPVDYAARAIVHCAVTDPSKALGRVLHVQNPQAAVPFEQVLQWMEAASKAPLERVPLAEFKSRVTANAGTSDTLAQVAAGFDSFDHYLAEPGDFGGDELAAALQGTGLTCPAVDSALVSTYAATLLANASNGDGGANGAAAQ